MDSSEIYHQVSERYSSAALSANDTPYSSNVAQAFGYTAEELSSIPKDANLGLSCGNPLALAKLSEGETVIDLGSGAGLDVFLAARRVGAHGKAVGVDMNKDMLARARKNQLASGLENVEFVEAAITAIPLPSSEVDCIISNCVINLVPELEKQLVFNEMYRLLKPGGRVAVSDILLKKELPEGMKESIALYVGCVAGASMVQEYEKYLKLAGFLEPVIFDTCSDLNIYTKAAEGSEAGPSASTEASKGCCQPSCCSNETKQDEELKNFVNKYKDADLNEWAGSYKIFAVKPKDN